MLTLGIETSGSPGSVALVRDGDVLAVRVLEEPRRRHAQTLVAEIDGLFRECGFQPADCDVTAVSIGPGSFTGLRVGVVCAKTFAYATGCRAVAVDTYVCTAYNSPVDVRAVWVIGDAQRGELFAGRYRRDAHDRWNLDQEIQIVPADDWCRDRTQDDVVSGPAVAALEAELSSRCRVLSLECRCPRAEIVARLGAQLVNNSGGDDFWSLQPRYIRPSAAEEKWKAAHDSA